MRTRRSVMAAQDHDKSIGDIYERDSRHSSSFKVRLFKSNFDEDCFSGALDTMASCHRVTTRSGGLERRLFNPFGT